MVSVIIPLFNAENTIGRALESVRLQEGFSDFEIIVVDDGSTDCSADIVKNYISDHPEMNIQLISQKNKGVSGARNTGLRLANGEFLALLDSDDEWLPNKIAKQLIYFKKNIDMLGTRRNNQKINWPYIVQNSLAEVTFPKLLIRNELQPSTVIFRRKILDSVGYFNENQRYAEDVNWYMRVLERRKIFILDENLVKAGNGKRSFGVSGLSANLKEMHRGFNSNLLEMYRAERISAAELLFYQIFYKFKYILLILRKNFGL